MTSHIDATTHCVGHGYWFPLTGQKDHGSKPAHVSDDSYKLNASSEASRKQHRRLLFQNMTLRYAMTSPSHFSFADPLPSATYALVTKERKEITILIMKVPSSS